MTKKIYRFPKPSSRTPRMNLNRLVTRDNNEEDLPIAIHGKKAYKTEARVARSLTTLGKSFAFQVEMPIAASPDWKSIDFIVDEMWPLEVYGKIGHDSQAEQANDAVREIQLNETFRKFGLMPMKIIYWWHLQEQRIVDNTIRELFF